MDVTLNMNILNILPAIKFKMNYLKLAMNMVNIIIVI